MSTPFADIQKTSTQFVDGLQKLAKLNMDTVQASFAEAAKTAQSFMAVKTPQEFTTLYTAELKAAPEKATAYGRQVQAIFAATTKA
jgi:phasin family protein